MYEANEKLITTIDIGSEEKGNLIPSGTDVTFIKIVNDSTDLAESLIAIEHEDKILVTLETSVKYKSWFKRRRSFKQLNSQMMVNNPRLRRYHPSIILRTYYKIYYYFSDRFGGKK